MPDKSKVSVLVIGGRFTPHFLGLIAQTPDAVEFVISNDSRAQYDTICNALGQIAGLRISAEPHFVSAYDMAETRRACREVARAHPQAAIMFDVTSAPKLMSFAAYDVVRRLKQRAIFVDTTNGRLVNLTPRRRQEFIEIRIKLKTYLACFGRRPVETFSFDRLSFGHQNARGMAQYLARRGRPAAFALAKLRAWSRGRSHRVVPFGRTEPLPIEQYRVFQELERLGAIAHLKRQDDGRISCAIPRAADREYLSGTWLEVFVWDEARTCRDDRGEPLFDDCGLSFEIPSHRARKEIDVGCMFRGQLLLCSCKTELRSFKTQHLEELRAVSTLVGDGFTTRLFVTNAFPPGRRDQSAHAGFEQFLEQARDRGIVIVTGHDLPDIGEILKLHCF